MQTVAEPAFSGGSTYCTFPPEVCDAIQSAIDDMIDDSGVCTALSNTAQNTFGASDYGFQPGGSQECDTEAQGYTTYGYVWFTTIQYPSMDPIVTSSNDNVYLCSAAFGPGELTNTIGHEIAHQYFDDTNHGVAEAWGTSCDGS